MELISLSESTSLPRDAAQTLRPAAPPKELSSMPGSDLEEALEAQEVIMSALAGLAARRRSAGDIDRFDEALRAMNEAADSKGFADAARRLEGAISDAAGNVPLAFGLEQLQRSAGQTLSPANRIGHGTKPADLLARYTRLADAIEQRDAEQASRSVSEIVECLRTAARPAPRALVNQPPASQQAAPRRGDRP